MVAAGQLRSARPRLIPPYLRHGVLTLAEVLPLQMLEPDPFVALPFEGHAAPELGEEGRRPWENERILELRPRAGHHQG